ncbi:hypothetical protein FPZ43_12170 [Mucilaginibacter pallidiroseus]|uniref:Uncharacterized protein n=1 Tax=Mucilaginibacter pallidiroseus TaxID=2599295 RepID=A0A563UCA0_9SPHI|nr:hypothetical protein [Mucilaginibacter pallidiroseus]TWR29011.1 hypothetical protein FPZ43_12170 [Mucilaginibacter pallidiroseus]
MKTKEEILDSFYSTGADGNPEMSANDLLNAMEAYARQAFEAAKQTQHGQQTFTSYADYVATLQPEPHNAEAETVRLVSETIIEQFIPHDPAVQQFSFDFKTSGKSYRVHYQKSAQGYWEFNGYDCL